MDMNAFKEIGEQLHSGVTEKGHPFRLFTLATQGILNNIGLRTVVLRKVSENLNLSFYTDRRSSKISEIEKESRISVLFYHPEKKLQLKIEGQATIEKDSEITSAIWHTLPDHSKKEYTTLAAPGTHLSQGESFDYSNQAHHFTMVHIIPEKIELLKLGKSHHTRILFFKSENGWQSNYLVP